MKSLTLNRNQVLFAALVVTLGFTKSWSLTADEQYGERTLAQSAPAAQPAQAAPAPQAQQLNGRQVVPSSVRARRNNKNVDVNIQVRRENISGTYLDEQGRPVQGSIEQTNVYFSCIGEGDSQICIRPRAVQSSDLNEIASGLKDWQQILGQYLQEEINDSEREARNARLLAENVKNCTKTPDGENISDRTEKLRCFADQANNAEEESDRKSALKKLEDMLKADLESEDESIRTAALDFLETISSKTYGYKLTPKKFMGMYVIDPMTGMPIYEMSRTSSSQTGYFNDSELQTRIDKFLMGASDHEQMLEYASCINDGMNAPQFSVINRNSTNNPFTCRAGIQSLYNGYNKGATYFGGGRADYEINKEIFEIWGDTNRELATQALTSPQQVYAQYFGHDSLDSNGTPGSVFNPGAGRQRIGVSQIPGLNGARTLADLTRYNDIGYDTWTRDRMDPGFDGRNYDPRLGPNPQFDPRNPAYNRGGVRSPVGYRPPFNGPRSYQTRAWDNGSYATPPRSNIPPGFRM